MADGLTPATAWRTVAKVNGTSLTPGAQVLFERGGEWREQLIASSSGTTVAPITFGAYGNAAASKPRFWGSDVLSNGGFSKVTGTSSTYQLTSAQTINSVFADHQFLRSAAVNTGSSDPATNRAFVDATPNSWAYAGGTLYVNTGGVDPAAAATTYTAAVRDDVVFSNAQSNLVFRDLVVDESAKVNAGYAFRIQGGQNVRVENSEAYRAGKHHFGVINSADFNAVGLYANSALPDQGYGGATAYVAYSDPDGVRDDSAWIDCVAENPGGSYPGFYTHGAGVGDILIQNLRVSGGPGIGIATESPQPQDIRIVGGHLDNASIVIYGKGVTVDGVRMTGKNAYIDLFGTDNVVQNVLMSGVKPESSYLTAIMDRGQGNTIQFNTIALDPTALTYATAIAFLSASVDTKVVGNIFDTPDAVLRQWFEGAGNVDSDLNLFGPDARVILNNTFQAMSQWQAAGMDLNTLLADPAFVDALAGDYRLADGSPAIDRIQAMLAGLPASDFDGNARPIGAGYDLGAFEALVPEPSLGAAAFVAIAALATRRGRRQHR